MCTRSEPTTVIGLMSGTSHDAIDAAAARLWSEDDTLVLQPLGMISEPYPAALRDPSAAGYGPAIIPNGGGTRGSHAGQRRAAGGAMASGERPGGRRGAARAVGRAVGHARERA